MNKELRKEYVNSYYPRLLWGQLDVLVDQIYEDVEELMKSKSCATCKHYDGSHSCLNEHSIAFASSSRVYPEDGCLQEFKPKE